MTTSKAVCVTIHQHPVEYAILLCRCSSTAPPCCIHTKAGGGYLRPQGPLFSSHVRVCPAVLITTIICDTKLRIKDQHTRLRMPIWYLLGGVIRPQGTLLGCHCT